MSLRQYFLWPINDPFPPLCVCVCVCEREREKEREGEWHTSLTISSCHHLRRSLTCTSLPANYRAVQTKYLLLILSAHVDLLWMLAVFLGVLAPYVNGLCCQVSENLAASILSVNVIGERKGQDRNLRKLIGTGALNREFWHKGPFRSTSGSAASGAFWFIFYITT